MRPELIASASGWLLTYLVHSTVLLGATWLATRRWVAAPHFRDLLWKAATIGGILSTSLQGWSGFEPIGGRLALSAALPHAADARDTGLVTHGWRGLIPRPSEDSEDELVAGARPRPAPDAAVPQELAGAPVESALSSRPPAIETVVVALWWLGAVVLGGAFLVQRRRAIRGLGRREPVTVPALVEMLAALRRQAGVRRPVRLTVAGGLSSPVALAGGEIVLPRAALTDLGPSEQQSLLAHELAHLERRDPEWLTFACLLERLLFFQPLNRLARVRQQEAAEYLCDDWAVRRTGSGDSLAACLLKVAGWIGGRPQPLPLAGMAERPSQLARRVHRLIEGNAMPAPARTLLLTIGALALIGATAVAAPSLMPAPRPEPGLEPDAAVASESLNEPLAATELQGVPADTDRVAPPAPPAPARNARLARAELLAATMRARVDAQRASVEAYRAMASAPPAPMPPMPPSVSIDAIAPSVTVAMAQARAELARYGRGRRQDTTNIAVPALIAALKDADVEVRRAAVRSLANLEDPRAVPAFIEATRDADAEVRASAAMGLGQLEDPRGQPAVVALLKDSDKQVRYAALSALNAMDGNVPADAILSAMNDADPEIRQAAIGLAFNQVMDRDEGAAPDPRFMAAFSRLLSDENPEVRGYAAIGLGEMRLTSAPAPLVAAAKDKSPSVRGQVAIALGRIGDPKTVPVLKELLVDASPEVRQQAVMALAEVRDHAALEALVAALKSSDAAVRRTAALALGQREE